MCRAIWLSNPIVFFESQASGIPKREAAAWKLRFFDGQINSYAKVQDFFLFLRGEKESGEPGQGRKGVWPCSASR